MSDAEAKIPQFINMTDRAAELRDSYGYLPLSCTAMREVGYAAITLGALYTMTDSKSHQTFASIPTIKKKCFVPRRTIQTHIDTLIEKGLVRNLGRQCWSNAGFKRRTCTLELTKRAMEIKKPYGVLPCWAARYLRSWPDRFVYSIILAQATLVESLEDEGNSVGAEDNYAFSERCIAVRTGRDWRCVQVDQGARRRSD